MAMGLRAHGRGLDCETAGAPSEKEFELVHFRRAIVEGLCAHAEKAIAQAPLKYARRACGGFTPSRLRRGR